MEKGLWYYIQAVAKKGSHRTELFGAKQIKNRIRKK